MEACGKWHRWWCRLVCLCAVAFMLRKLKLTTSVCPVLLLHLIVLHTHVSVSLQVDRITAAHVCCPASVFPPRLPGMEGVCVFVCVCGGGLWVEGTLWRWTTLSQWDGVCRNASIFFYSIIIMVADVIVTIAISGSGWAAETERQKRLNGETETLEFRRWIWVV